MWTANIQPGHPKKSVAITQGEISERKEKAVAEYRSEHEPKNRFSRGPRCPSCGGHGVNDDWSVWAILLAIVLVVGVVLLLICLLSGEGSGGSGGSNGGGFWYCGGGSGRSRYRCQDCGTTWLM